MNKYTKVVYESDPIGKERIVLILTTLDLEKFEKEQLEKIPTQQTAKVIDIPKRIEMQTGNEVIINEYYSNMFKAQIEKFIVETYDEQIEKMKAQIEYLKSIKIVPMEYKKEIQNITNSDDVHCDIVHGNITNCDNVYCNEIKGNVVNCDKIIYKKGE